MSHTISSHRTASTAFFVALVIGFGALTACQTPDTRSVVVEPAPTPTAGTSRTAPGTAGQYAGMSADRIAEALARAAERNQALAARFEGVPADRVEEQLARQSDR